MFGVFLCLAYFPPRFSAKAPALLRAWHSRAVQLRALRQDMEANDAAQLKKLFDAWAEHLQEERANEHIGLNFVKIHEVFCCM